MWTNSITVVETLALQHQADDVWRDDAREGFVDFIGRNPEAGDVIKTGERSAKFGGAGQSKP